ncbi:hypothetical protein [Mycobacterium ulcerans]|uniref:hypothetical protein n=1 Tax=Mycobacterium ulcerans TaxID=1809 RepID=UPI0012FF6900|nr:hypothetical protein [Mycobacterium ulcerans]
MRPFRPRHTGADQAAYTLTATVPGPPRPVPAGSVVLVATAVTVATESGAPLVSPVVMAPLAVAAVQAVRAVRAVKAVPASPAAAPAPAAKAATEDSAVQVATGVARCAIRGSGVPEVSAVLVVPPALEVRPARVVVVPWAPPVSAAPAVSVVMAAPVTRVSPGPTARAPALLISRLVSWGIVD